MPHFFTLQCHILATDPYKMSKTCYRDIQSKPILHNEAMELLFIRNMTTSRLGISSNTSWTSSKANIQVCKLTKSCANKWVQLMPNTNFFTQLKPVSNLASIFGQGGILILVGFRIKFAKFWARTDSNFSGFGDKVC